MHMTCTFSLHAVRVAEMVFFNNDDSILFYINYCTNKLNKHV